MKLEELYEGLLEEGISPIVYHTTGFQAALKILSSDRFIMSAAHDTEQEYALSKKLFYMSTSRSKLNPFNRKVSYMGTVTFTLNGRTLSNTLHGKAVDFFGAGYSRHDGVTYEMEDRIMSTHPTIERVSKHILEVSVHISEKRYNRMYSGENQEILNFLTSIDRICKTRGIKFGIYITPQDFALSKRSLPLPTSDTNTTNSANSASTNMELFREDIAMFQSFIYLIRKAKDKEYRGRYDSAAVRKLQQEIRTNGGAVVNKLARLLQDRNFISLPVVREQISFLMKDIKQSGKTSDLYIIHMVRFFLNEGNRI